MSFEIQTQREPGVLVLRPAGYINDRGGAQIRTECEAALAENLLNIIIDFHRSDQINSIGIASLIAVIERVDETGGKLAFTGLSQTVREVFDIMGITRHVLVFDDAESARLSILPPPPASPEDVIAEA